MEEDEKAGGGGESSSSRVTPSFVKSGDRQVFTVELRPGDTTIVSWKKLLKDANKVNSGSASGSIPVPSSVATATAVHSPLEAEAVLGQPVEPDAKDAAPPNRFSAVIEKIERLYMGKDSSDDEDLNDIPDDDQYDTEDSFIDDAELDEYFEVDNAAVKHDGFFVNRGKLECINETIAPPNQQPKKRRRKDMVKGTGERDDGMPNKHIKVGKAAAGRVAPLVAGSSIPSQSSSMMREPSEDSKVSNQFNFPGTGSKKKSADNKVMLDFASSGKAANGDASALLAETKDTEKQKILGLQAKSVTNKLRDPSGLLDIVHHKYQDRNASAPSKSQSGKSLTSADKVEASNRSREKHGVREVPDLNMPDGRHIETSKSVHIHRKDVSGVRPKGSLLEKAIRDLEKMVAESRPPTMENQEADTSSQAVKRRLPSEIKQKLAKVARLAQSSHGKISKELIIRLDSILGHLIQLRTLKRNLKIMVTTDLSVKQEKENRFQQIKKEVADMVRIRVLSLESKVLEQQAGASDDFQEFGSEDKGLSRRKYDMDPAMEDKICELYDLYVDGLDEEIGPQVRKLYAELAELWPNGFMDNHGIKRAICRAKERKNPMQSRKAQEKIRRKKLLTPKPEPTVRGESGSAAQSQHHTAERLASDSTIHSSTSANKPVPARIVSPLNGPALEKPKNDKTRGGTSHSGDDPRLSEAALQKKKVRRKPEVDLNEMPVLEKLPPPPHPPQYGDERINVAKQLSAGLHPVHKSSLQSSFEQSS